MVTKSYNDVNDEFVHFVWLQDPYNKLHFSLTGQGTATDFFTINEDTGIISLKKSLLAQNENQYIVSLL